MSRIATTFERLARGGRKALIPYITAGDPDLAATVPLMHALVQAGADVLELGVPFSDPMADGPVIQRASERSLARGVDLAQVLAWAREFRQQDAGTPLVLMGYANPVERFGVENFVPAAQAAGVDGVLVVDYPPEEAGDFANRLRAAGMDPIFLLAPTSTEARMRQVDALASGYVYYVSLKGVTGAGNLDAQAVCRKLQELRKHVRVPLGVGFGIRDAAGAAAVAACADAVVIGSRIIELMENKPVEVAIEDAVGFVHEIRRAIDAHANAPAVLAST
ncbi:MAG: tryptophan synthase subunit alpha [Thiomonas sp. 15-66-11]|jgi:tryptophan synthase alpha chain|uniref:Tryptophan synthase alpha chain n=1 Tax=Thiomonas delicata TaxID=364030 RepID=A0A238D4L8_THIDL|nr:tryptophan synthase subunit alpha [Thiomonas delicata]OZB44741.1 MAG: tryptophan synthase subunit alpha [Thiomonas sp. 15-66-11]SBP88171.1 tryptophan synthase alpha chain [Thiomonas delicata]